MEKILSRILICLTLAVTLTSCAHHNTAQRLDTAIGSGVGAGLGAALGQVIGRNTESTLIGSGIGAVLGGVVGNHVSTEQEYTRRQPREQRHPGYNDRNSNRQPYYGDYSRR